MYQSNGDGEVALEVTGEIVIDARPEATDEKSADQCLVDVDGQKFRFPREAADELARLYPVFANHVLDRLRAALPRRSI